MNDEYLNDEFEIDLFELLKTFLKKIHLIFLFTYTSRGIAPPVPLCGYAAKGSSQEGEPPMLQSAIEAVLRKLT